MTELKSVWPGWETVRVIGRGSYGTVYEVRRDMLGEMESAVVKVISIPKDESDLEEMYSDGYDEESITNTFQEQLKGIVAEYSLMRKMNGCANVVSCDDIRYVQKESGLGWDVYIKMELLTPLVKALPERIPETMVLDIARDMCGALILCKQYNIIHRDIKPQNILLSPNGDYKLGDFGIAKTVEKTSGGTPIGTYRYIAPEVFYNKPYGAAADIYSLGLVLYWLLNERRMPFIPLPPKKVNAEADERARIRRLSGEPLPPPAHGSAALKAIVLKACAYDQAQRYGSAAEMLLDLRKLGEDSRIEKKIPAQTVEEPAEDIEQTMLMQEDISQPEEIERTMLMPEKAALAVADTEQTMLLGEENASFRDPEQTMLMEQEAERIRKEKQERYRAQLEQERLRREKQERDSMLREQILQKETKRTKHKGSIFVVLILMAAILATVVFLNTRTGWAKEGGNYYYYNQGQRCVGLYDIEGYRYCFDFDGKMYTGWDRINDSMYYFDPASGAMVVGWRVIDQQTYYFETDGRMHIGWLHTGNGSYYFDVNSGEMRTGWQIIKGNRYYFNENGTMRTGWLTVRGNIFYFDRTGKMCTGWQEILSSDYYFDLNSGAMYTGTRVINGKTYTFDTDGRRIK